MIGVPISCVALDSIAVRVFDELEMIASHLDRAIVFFSHSPNEIGKGHYVRLASSANPPLKKR